MYVLALPQGSRLLRSEAMGGQSLVTSAYLNFQVEPLSLHFHASWNCPHSPAPHNVGMDSQDAIYAGVAERSISNAVLLAAASRRSALGTLSREQADALSHAEMIEARKQVRAECILRACQDVRSEQALRWF